MYQNYLQGMSNLSVDQQMKKQMRFMYEEESHYYIDVLCDEYCEIDGQNQIVYVEEEQQTEPSTGLPPIKETSMSLEEVTEDIPSNSNDKEALNK